VVQLLYFIVIIFSNFYSFDIPHQFIHRLFILLLFYTIEHDAPSGLEVDDSVFEGHSSDRDAHIHRVICEIKTANGTGIDTTLLFLKISDKLDGLNFRCSRNGARREYRSEGIKSEGN